MCSFRIEMFTYVLCLMLFALPLECTKCTTPEGKDGACTPVEDCERIKDFLGKPSLKADEVAFLQQSRQACADSDNISNFCCEKENTNEDFPFPKHCGQQPNEDKIINGVVANIDEFPWMALLKYKTDQGYGYGCGASLVNDRYVITAAHCVIGMFGPPVEVTLGEYDVTTVKDCTRVAGFEECSGPTQEIPVESVIKHEEYAPPSKLHDIALIRLKYPVNYTEFIKPICMPTDEIMAKIVKPNAHMDVAGWGKTKLRQASTVKQKAKVPLVDNETCSVNRTTKIASSQICAGGGKQDTCAGDSGGPLMGLYSEDDNMIHWYLCGVVSYGPKSCGLKDIPSVYTNVNFYRKWLIANIKP